MSNYIVTDTDMTLVADAIRAKGATGALLLWPSGFVSAVGAIPSGGGDIGTVESISALYHPGDHWVFNNDTLAEVKPYITVIGHTTGGIDVVVSDFTLSGTLQTGTSTLTVTANGLTCTVNVTGVVDFYNNFHWFYDENGNGNMMRLMCGTYDSNVSGVRAAYFTQSSQALADRRGFAVSKGVKPVVYNDNGTYVLRDFYPVPIPPTATKAVVTITPSTMQSCIYISKLDSTVEAGYKRYIQNLDWSTGGGTMTFTASSDLFIGGQIRVNSESPAFTTEPAVDIRFS